MEIKNQAQYYVILFEINAKPINETKPRALKELIVHHFRLNLDQYQ